MKLYQFCGYMDNLPYIRTIEAPSKHQAWEALLRLARSELGNHRPIGYTCRLIDNNGSHAA